MKSPRSKPKTGSDDLWQWAERRETVPAEHSEDSAEPPLPEKPLLARLRDALFRS